LAGTGSYGILEMHVVIILLARTRSM